MSVAAPPPGRWTVWRCTPLRPAPATARLSARLAHGAAGLRHHRRPEVGHDLVAGAHRRAPARRPTTRPEARTALLRPFLDRWPNGRAVRTLSAHFPRPAGSLAGEKTPGYLYQPWVARMLAHAAPEAKLIVLMRDPVERVRLRPGPAATLGALKGHIGAGDVGSREHRIVEAMDRGLYATQLAWWLGHVPRQRFLLLQYERCVADTPGQLARTFEYLGAARPARFGGRDRAHPQEVACAGAAALADAPPADGLLRGRRGSPGRPHARLRPGPLERPLGRLLTSRLGSRTRLPGVPRPTPTTPLRRPAAQRTVGATTP